jgi:TetR/AcrR family transcriptional regulator
MSRPRAATYDSQREQILAAAAAVFAARGYTGSSMNDVARGSGVSKATLYHYFRDKHELLWQIAIGHVERLEALVAVASVRALPPRPRLLELIERFCAAYASAQNEHRVLTEDVKFLAHEQQRAVQRGQRRVVAAFADAIAELRPDLARARRAKPLAMLLFGMINWTFTWLKPAGPIGHEELAATVSQLFFGGLGAVSAAEGEALTR